MPHLTFATPTGCLHVTEVDGAIVAIRWVAAQDADAGDDTPALREARGQLEDYFSGRRRSFDLPVRVAGTELQLAVWREMQKIPYGETRTYGELADAVGSNARAVGSTCGQNPVPVVIPCHRVMGANGRLTGFSGGAGTETKRALLTLEGALLV